MENIKIVTDSSADISELVGVDLAVAPLKITTQEKEYVDDINLDVQLMVDELSQYHGKSHTSCPAPADWENAFGNAEKIICVTITGALSGSYNAACIAKKDYEEKFPERRVFVVDSLSTGPEIQLIIEKAAEYIADGKSFDEICSAITEYKRKTSLIFMLESMKNLANNGRVSPFVAKAAGLLGIRIVGKASDEGTLESLEKKRGEHKSLIAIIENMRKNVKEATKVRIGHCFNESAAAALKDMIIKEFNSKDIKIYQTRGLCSFYAEKGGLMIGFEKEAAM